MTAATASRPQLCGKSRQVKELVQASRWLPQQKHHARGDLRHAIVSHLALTFLAGPLRQVVEGAVAWLVIMVQIPLSLVQEEAVEVVVGKFSSGQGD